MEEPGDLEPALRGGLEPRPQAVDEDHTSIVRRLVEFYKTMKEHQPSATAPYQPGGEWSDYIAERAPLYRALTEGDESRSSEILSNFWRNELGPIVSQYAYYPQLAARDPEKIKRFTTSMYRDHQLWRALVSDPLDVLRVPQVGNPWGLVIDHELITPQAFRFDLQVRQILDLLVDEGNPLILEIGAGYGGTAHRILLVREDVRYIDVDLPETAVIAAYWLMSTLGSDLVTLWSPTTMWPNESRIMVAPNYALPDIPTLSAQLILNAFSFSEIPHSTLTEYFNQIDRVAERYLLHANMDRQGVVNRGHERVPASRFPINRLIWKRLYKKPDLFQGAAGDYREELLERRRDREAT